ncbi:hypothetical protein [Balneatrix alpica]|uniref:Uncharacterized protein n=1 Tax=Balneatrix alpica TaxID=75684 RepID=A0ABV5Z834_9GAMM|nr:hypothetical protein [Balneatrix alpica]
MRKGEDFELPSLGPADEPRQQLRRDEPGSRSGPGWLPAMLVLAVLAAYVVWSELRYQREQGQSQIGSEQVEQTQRRLSEIEALLSATQVTSSESGQQLQSTLGQIKLGQQYISEQQQQMLTQQQEWQGQIDKRLLDFDKVLKEQAQLTDELRLSLSALSDRLGLQQQQLQKQSDQLLTLQKQQDQQQSASLALQAELESAKGESQQLAVEQQRLASTLDSRLQQLQSKPPQLDEQALQGLRQSLAQLEQKLTQLAQTQQQAQAELGQWQERLAKQDKRIQDTERLAKQNQTAAKGGSVSDLKVAELEERLYLSEEAIRAIDAFRLQVSQRLATLEDRLKRK